MTDPIDSASDQRDTGESASDETVSSASKTSKTVKSGRSVLAAAMIGLGQVLEPEKFDEDMHIEASADDDQDDPLKNISFGTLPPLD